MKLAQLTDSHIGSSNSDFPYYVCCNNYGITNACGTPILKKFQDDDSHVKVSGEGIDIYVSHPTGISCTTRNDECNQDEICIVSLLGDDEYHVGECSAYDDYSPH